MFSLSNGFKIQKAQENSLKNWPSEKGHHGNPRKKPRIQIQKQYPATRSFALSSLPMRQNKATKKEETGNGMPPKPTLSQ
jgi:hypothetical protein